MVEQKEGAPKSRPVFQASKPDSRAGFWITFVPIVSPLCVQTFDFSVFHNFRRLLIFDRRRHSCIESLIALEWSPRVSHHQHQTDVTKWQHSSRLAPRHLPKFCHLRNRCRCFRLGADRRTHSCGAHSTRAQACLDYPSPNSRGQNNSQCALPAALANSPK